MKIVVTLIIAFLAIPLMGEEPTKAQAKPDPETAAAPATSTAPDSQPATAAKAAPTTDSPLVQAAKRANRLGKKPTSKVITNATLAESGANAHVTTTTNQPPIKLPKKVEEPVAKKVDPPKAAAPAEPTREQKIEAAALEEDEGFIDDNDPAQVEKRQQEANAEKKPPRF